MNNKLKPLFQYIASPEVGGTDHWTSTISRNKWLVLSSSL